MHTSDTLHNSVFDLDRNSSDSMIARDSFAQQNDNLGSFKDPMLALLEPIDNFDNETSSNLEFDDRATDQVETLKQKTDSTFGEDDLLTGSTPAVNSDREVLSLAPFVYRTRDNSTTIASNGDDIQRSEDVQKESSIVMRASNSNNGDYQHDLNFDDAVMSDEGGYQQYGSYKIFEDGKEYNAYLESEYDKIKQPWLSGGNAFEGSKALGIAAYETDVWDKQRVMYHIDSIYFEKQTISFGFAFKLGMETAPPEDYAIIHQFWQSGGGATNPPLETQIAPGENSDEFRLIVLARNNQTKNYHNDPSGTEPYTLVDVEIEKDKYYDFEMEFIPSYNGDGISGKFKMWMDGTVISDYPEIDIGYDPSIQLAPNGKTPDDFLHNTIGIYRYGPEPHFQAYFDNIRMSDSRF